MVQTEAFKKARAEGRVATQFKPGHEVSAETREKISKSGRISAQKSRQYYMVAMRNCSFEEWGEVIRTAVQQAIDGNHQARKWLGDYLMGPPVKQTEITGKDGGPIMLASSDLTEEQRMMRIQAMIEVAMARRDENVVDVTPNDSSDT